MKEPIGDAETLGRRGSLSGRVAVITGAASGIGRATAQLFAAEGAAVVAVDLDEVRGNEVADTIKASAGRAMFVAADVTQAANCVRIVERARAAFGRLDILFNNAGIIRRASVLETVEEEWDSVMAVNVKSIFLLSRAAIPIMIEGGGGVIVNAGSGWGLVGGRRAAAYCASKGAVVQLTRAMAIDHGEHNIRVNCVCPGDTDTPMLRREAAELEEPVDRFLSQAAERPLHRLGTPEEIARAVLYLASDASSFVTGTTLVVDGGGLAG